jgi:hypothetical protein
MLPGGRYNAISECPHPLQAAEPRISPQGWTRPIPVHAYLSRAAGGGSAACGACRPLHHGVCFPFPSPTIGALFSSSEPNVAVVRFVLDQGGISTLTGQAPSPVGGNADPNRARGHCGTRSPQVTTGHHSFSLAAWLAGDHVVKSWGWRLWRHAVGLGNGKRFVPCRFAQGRKHSPASLAPSAWWAHHNSVAG